MSSEFSKQYNFGENYLGSHYLENGIPFAPRPSTGPHVDSAPTFSPEATPPAVGTPPLDAPQNLLPGVVDSSTMDEDHYSCPSTSAQPLEPAPTTSALSLDPAAGVPSQPL